MLLKDYAAKILFLLRNFDVLQMKKKSPIKYYTLVSFALNLLIAMFIFVPFIIQGKGLFTLSYDFDAQELAFNIFANREIKELDILFNWSIDIGSEFIPSFSFYNIGSPFFWITLPFKPEFFPYLIGWIYILKYAVCGLTSFLYLKRFTSERAALIGSVMYSFSGFQCINMVFYHFHDVVAFFPLLLIGFEELTQNKRKGIFAFTVALNALVNWNFFIGEVIFLVIYFIVRLDISLGRSGIKEVFLLIGQLMTEGVIGVGVSAILFIPSVYQLMQGNRVSDSMSLKDGVIWKSTEFLTNIKGLLFPAESMNYNSVIEEMNWYSSSLYLPMTGCSMAAAWMFYRHPSKDRVSKMLVICAIIASVPILNGIFVFFNREPYRRWYYMFILIMVLASAKMIDALDSDSSSGAKKMTFISSTVISVCAFLVYIASLVWKWDEEGNSVILVPEKWNITFLLGIIGIVVTTLIIVLIRFPRIRVNSLFAGIIIWSVATGVYTINQYKERSGTDTQETYNFIMNSTAEVTPDILPYRYAILDHGGYFNNGMIYSLTSKNSFISTVHNGIFEYYEAVGYPRHSITPSMPVGTDRLFSVGYWITTNPEAMGLPVDQVVSVYNNGNEDVYLVQDIYALPIGNAYDKYILRSEFDKIPKESRGITMLTSLVVRDEDEDKVSGVLYHEDASSYLDRNGVLDPARDLQQLETVDKDTVQYSRKSFRSAINITSDKYVFFSVPYSERWSATVNGEPVEVLDICGLMAVPVHTGYNDIVFSLDIKLYVISAMISMISTVSLLVLYILDKKKKGLHYKKLPGSRQL